MITEKITNLDELKRIIVNEAADAANNTESRVYDVISSEIYDTTQRMVYDRYTPAPNGYKRRKVNKGLLDPRKIYPEGYDAVDKSTRKVIFKQEVRGNFSPNSTYFTNNLASTINEGWGTKDKPYNEPSGHLDELNNFMATKIQSEFVNALKYDLHEKGYKVT